MTVGVHPTREQRSSQLKSCSWARSKLPTQPCSRAALCGMLARPAAAGTLVPRPQHIIILPELISSALCAGVIVETEELHRKAYNASFKHFYVRCRE